MRTRGLLLGGLWIGLGALGGAACVGTTEVSFSTTSTSGTTGSGTTGTGGASTGTTSSTGGATTGTTSGTGGAGGTPCATVCEGVCVDTQTDPANCNGCGQACAPGYACHAGQCACDKTSCGGACVDLQTDPANCGSCGKPCPTGLACQGGQCLCAGSICGGACVDPQTDPANCGGCGKPCPPGNLCQGGLCQGCPQSDLLVLLDLSASMSGSLSGMAGQRLGEAVNGINAFAADPATTAQLGLAFFPLQNGSCDPTVYAAPTVPIGPLPGNTPAIANALGSAVAGGPSPQLTALQGALASMKAYVQAHANHHGAVVLVTDGLPDACTTPGIPDDVATVAAAFLAGTPSIKTYVVTLGADVAQASWDAIAAAGGTGASTRADGISGVTHVVQSALDGVLLTFGACGDPGPCAHDECTQGAALSVGCSPCVTTICQHDPFCCTQQWDQVCQAEVPTWCPAKTCP